MEDKKIPRPYKFLGVAQCAACGRVFWGTKR
jgi:hypothetical protein